MRRLLRILDGSAAVLLTVLWAVLIAAWVRGNWATVTFIYGDGERDSLIAISEGRIGGDTIWIGGRHIPQQFSLYYTELPASIDGGINKTPPRVGPLGWHYYYIIFPWGGDNDRFVSAPCWQIAILLALYPLWYAWRWRSRRRRRRTRGFAVLPAG